MTEKKELSQLWWIIALVAVLSLAWYLEGCSPRVFDPTRKDLRDKYKKEQQHKLRKY